MAADLPAAGVNRTELEASYRSFKTALTYLFDDTEQRLGDSAGMYAARGQQQPQQQLPPLLPQATANYANYAGKQASSRTRRNRNGNGNGNDVRRPLSPRAGLSSSAARVLRQEQQPPNATGR